MFLDINSILILVGIGLFAGVVNTLAGGGSLSYFTCFNSFLRS